MSDPLVIDTCSLSDKGFCQWLRNYRGRKILPMIAYMEFYSFMLAKSRSHEEIMAFLGKLGLEIEPFNQRYAIIAAGTLRGSGEYAFLKHWRDHSIGSHAHTAPLTVITYNVKDFGFLEGRVTTPTDLMRR